MTAARRQALRDKTAICGVAITGIGSFPDRTSLQLAAEAFRMALADAGLQKDEVDGLVCFTYGADYDRFLDAVGLDVRYAYQGWNHGRFLVPMIAHASLAVHHGMADVVAIVHGRRVRPFGTAADAEMWRQGLGPHGESPGHGAVAPAFGAAVAAQRYFHLFGGGNEDLADIAVAFREHAQLNPLAVRREPMTVADHQASPWIVEPLRLFDCCNNNDGGVCILITTADRARDLRRPPVLLSAIQGVTAGPNFPIFGHTGLGVHQQRESSALADATGVYADAGISRDDVDSLATYDAFSPLVLFALERFGFCGPGDARHFVKSGRIALGGELPVNTSGGLLSEGHLSGWNLIVEVVRQLRGDCGPRQVPGANVIQWASFSGDSIIFRRDR